MQCPACAGVQLVMSERSGIEIDYCPKCRGVWLDRGELDKIIERAAPVAASVQRVEAPMDNRQPQYAQPPNYPPGYGQQGHGQHGHPQPQYQSDYYKKKKREGFLSDLFDFD